VGGAFTDLVRNLLRRAVTVILSPSAEPGKKRPARGGYQEDRLVISALSQGRRLLIRVARSGGAPEKGTLEKAVSSLGRQAGKAGGSLTVTCRQGQHASIDLSLPSLGTEAPEGILHVIARAGETVYALPAENVAEVIPAGPGLQRRATAAARASLVRVKGMREARVGIVVGSGRNAGVLLFDSVEGSEPLSIVPAVLKESEPWIIGTARRSGGADVLVLDPRALLAARVPRGKPGKAGKRTPRHARRSR
jgi:hypothetical protein